MHTILMIIFVVIQGYLVATLFTSFQLFCTKSLGVLDVLSNKLFSCSQWQSIYFSVWIHRMQNS